MPSFAGLRGTGDWGPDERPKNFREGILWENPNGEAPLQALLSKMGSQGVDDPEFSWWEESLNATRCQVAQEDDTSATTLTLPDEDAFGFVTGDLLILEGVGGLWDGEIIYVAQDPTVNNQLTVVRGYSGTTAAQIPADSFFCRIGTAFEEGTRSPKSTAKNPTKYYNYCQIFKKTYSITNTARKTKARTGDPVANDKKRKLNDVMCEMELGSMFGRRSETIGTNGKPQRTTAGILQFIQTNRTAFGGGAGQTAWTEDNLIDFLAPVFDVNGEGAGNERIAFVGNGALTAINKLARNSNSTRINFDKAVTNYYGMKFERWILPQGDIYFKTHPLFNTNPSLTKAMAVLNPRGIMERVLRKLDFKDNVQENDADNLKGQWLAEVGYELHHEKTMAFGSNLGG